MPHSRFYTTDPLEGTVTLKDKEHHHLSAVMRIRENETVELVNGKWQLATGTVLAIKKKETLITVDSMHEFNPEENRLTLAIPLMPLSSLEIVLEKCTEIGAHAFWLYRAERSEKSSLSDNQLRRLRQITISAMKQCGRLDLPNFEVYSSFLNLPIADMPILFGDLSKEATAYKKERGLCLFCSGPEKGFSAREIQHLWEKGKGITLCPHILRAETAPLVFSSLYFAP
jgi:16S rRNA (uracil1498-N3)-methyltransferase